MNEWKRILSDRRRRMAMVSIPILCLFLFFYQKCSGDFSTLATDAQEYRQLLEQYRHDSPTEIVEAYNDHWSLTREEERLLAQAEHLQNYEEYLKRVQEQADNMQVSSIFGANRNSFAYRNILKTAEDFSSCTSEGIRLGNDRAIEYWMGSTLADWGFLGLILLMVMSFMEERTKGLAAIIRTCSAGRGKLQLSRMMILLAFCAGMTSLLYALPLGLSFWIDGGWHDLLRPIQSLAEFQKCTVSMSIAGFLIRFFCIKTICGFGLGLLLWFVLSFLNRPQMGWLVTGVGLVAEYVLYTLIPAQSVFSLLRDVNVFSYVFPLRLYTQYANINFFGFPVGRRTLLMGLLVLMTAVLSLSMLWILPKRYPFGNRDWMGKWIHRWNRMGDALRKHLNLYSFEVYKLLFLGFGGLFLLLGFLMSRNLTCGTVAYIVGEDPIYRQYVEEIQGPVTRDTYNYLTDAGTALEQAEMDTTHYEMALDRLEETLAHLEDGAWLVYEPLFLNCYGLKSSITQRQNALLVYVFLIVCLVPLYACEHTGDICNMIRSTSGGRQKLFWTKYVVALTVMVIVWLRVLCGEWQLSLNYIGAVIASAPCSSISLLQNLPFTVKEALTILYLFKLICLLIPMHLCIFIGEQCRNFEKTCLFCGLLILLPAAAYTFGMDGMAFLTPASFLADCSPIFYGSKNIFCFAGWMTASVLILLAAKRNWCKTL